MSKVFKVEDLKPGMYLQKIYSPWLEHSFWKTGFLLKIEDICLLKENNVGEVLIDLTKSYHLNTLNHKDKVDSHFSQSPTPSSQSNKKNTDQNSNTKAPISLEIKKAQNIVRNSSFKVQQLFSQARLGKAIDINDIESMVSEINDSITRNSDALISIVRLKNKDNYTYMHSVAVCALMISLAKKLGYDNDFIKKAGMAGLLHDIGKMFIPLNILNKPAKLTDLEFQIIKTHPVHGWDLLKKCEHINEEILDVCLHHHEKIDGTGYPSNLKGDDISVISKMAAVCDIYDAITSDRPYKKGWEPTISIKNMSQWTGHFDNKIFCAFVSSIGIYPVGSIVKLSSGKVAVVYEKDEKNLLTPKVKAFFSLKSNMRITPELIDLSKPNVKEKIESHELSINFNFQDIFELLSNN